MTINNSDELRLRALELALSRTPDETEALQLAAVYAVFLSGGEVE